MTTFYKIADAYQSVMNRIMDSDEITQADLDELDAHQGDGKEKAINSGFVIKELESRAAMIKDAIKEMEKRQLSALNKAQSLREYVIFQMQRCKLDEVNSPYFDMKLRKNNPGVDILDNNIIPIEYFREKVTKTVDKTLILNHLKQGVIVPGAALERKTRIEIK